MINYNFLDNLFQSYCNFLYHKLNSRNLFHTCETFILIYDNYLFILKDDVTQHISPPRIDKLELSLKFSSIFSLPSVHLSLFFLIAISSSLYTRAKTLTSAQGHYFHLTSYHFFLLNNDIHVYIMWRACLYFINREE